MSNPARCRVVLILLICLLQSASRVSLAAGADLSVLSDFGRPDIPLQRAGITADSASHVAGIEQIGVRNAARIDQSSGSDNTAMVWQEGNDGLASVEQIGTGNEARLLQRMNGNRAEIIQIGQRNEVAIQQIAGMASVQGQQIGVENRVVLVQDTAASLTFLQQGNGNLIQADMPPGLALRVEQVGDGMYFGVSR